MKLDKICRTCLAEKSTMKPLFDACIPSMLMTCTSVQIMEGDGFPNQICLQCLQMINRTFSFKQQCEKSDLTLRQYINSINLQIETEQSLMNQVKNDQLFCTTDVLQQSSFFNDIFNDTNTQSFVDNFEAQNADLAETMQSLQTIAEQCLPPSWENDVQLVNVNVNSGSEETCDSFNFPQLHKCQFCGEIYKDEWTFSEHIKIHAGQAKYFCDICGKQCNTTLALMKHNEIHLIEKDLKAGEKVKPDSKLNICTMCNKEFLDLRTLKKHLKDIHSDPKDKKYICSICDKSYPQNKLLTIHMRVHTGDRPLSCETCGKSFALPSSLHKHRLLHVNLKRFECTICQKKFNQASNLNVHLRSHTGEKPFICTICSKRCSSHVNLSVHMRTHTGEKPYKCTICGVAFTTSSQLKKHTLRHTGERPYKCWHCGKSFRQKDTRDTHIRYHTGERPYSCSFCPKKYIAANHLRVHLKSHSDEKKYCCNLCDKKYVDNRSYKLHMLNHVGEHPFKCETCGKCFSRANALNTHLKSHNALPC